MGDMVKVLCYIRTLDKMNEGLPIDQRSEINDACARVIASMYHESGKPATIALSSTGAITKDDLYGDLFYVNGTNMFETASEAEQLMMGYMGTYLLNRKDRGPVANWSDLWL